MTRPVGDRYQSKLTDVDWDIIEHAMRLYTRAVDHRSVQPARDVSKERVEKALTKVRERKARAKPMRNLLHGGQTVRR